MQFMNNCALTESLYALMQLFRNANYRWPFPSSNEVQASVSTFEGHRPEQADFTVICDSPSIGAGQDIALF